MHTELTREKAIQLLREYNKEPFHIRHGLTVGGVLKWYANELGCGEEADFWEICGILHDIDSQHETMYGGWRCIHADSDRRCQPRPENCHGRRIFTSAIFPVVEIEFESDIIDEMRTRRKLCRTAIFRCRFRLWPPALSGCSCRHGNIHEQDCG